MYVQLRTGLSCAPDDAWRALRSTDLRHSLYAPLFRFHTESGPGDPAPEAAIGEESPRHTAHLFGLFPLVTRTPKTSFERASRGDVRIFRDSGGVVAGPLSHLYGWQHRIAISEDPGHPGGTLYHDRLEFKGRGAVIAWPLLWALWQWRGSRLRRLSKLWISAEKSSSGGSALD